MKTLARLPVVLLLLVLAACAGAGGRRSPLESALYEYVSAVRWSDFDAAHRFVDPALAAQRPYEGFVAERYKQFQVSGYEVKSRREAADGVFEQVVEIRVVNRNTQVEKIITDRQRWRWDADAGRWWLATGLPDLDAAR